jgi:acyl dehydratase
VPLRIFSSPQELSAAVGQQLGPGPWVSPSRAQVASYMKAVYGDRTPPEVGVLPGYLTLALLGGLQTDLYRVECERIVNYGLDQIQFLHEIPLDTRFRILETVKSASPQGEAIRVTTSVAIEAEAVTGTAATADVTYLYY